MSKIRGGMEKVKGTELYISAHRMVRPPGFEPGIAGLEGLHQNVCVLPG
jgi:hypothetical protein